MSTPEYLPGQMAQKSDADLSVMLEHPEDWTSEALNAARVELRRRGIDPDAIKPLPPEPATDESIAVDEPCTEGPGQENARPKLTYKQQAHYGIGGSILVGCLLRMVHVWDDVPAMRFLELIILLITLGLSFWGCSGYAAGKGYSKWLGALGGLCCIGLVILILLPDRRKGFDDHES